MPRKESEAVPAGNGPVPQQEEVGPDQPTLANLYRFFKDSKGSKNKMTSFSIKWTSL